MRNILLAMMLMLLPMSVYAGHEHAHAVAAPTDGQIVHVGVDGMVCDFCAQSLKKVFLKEKSVKDIDISLADKLITLTLKPDAEMDDKQITKLIDYAGYKVTGIHRVVH